jgi:hypothetical protein
MTFTMKCGVPSESSMFSILAGNAAKRGNKMGIKLSDAS